MIIKPFAALRPKPEFVTDVVAPPYDIVTLQQARAIGEAKPRSFLHLTKPEIDIPAGVALDVDVIYKKATENFADMQAAGIFLQDTQECFYLYRLSHGTHQQTGVIAVAATQGLVDGRIRKHESTRPDKEQDRLRQIIALNAQTEPVFAFYRQQLSLDTLLQTLTLGMPIYDVVAEDKVRHQVWQIANKNLISEISDQLNVLEHFYIADGHHRATAAARLTELRQVDANNPAAYFLCALFPANQLQILGYHRVVKDLSHLTSPDFLAKLQERFTLEPCDKPVLPTAAYKFGMYFSKQWYRLALRPEFSCKCDTAEEQWAATLLGEHLLGPILEIADSRRDPRLDFVGGAEGIAYLMRAVDSGEAAVAFTLYPVTIEDVITLADTNRVLPPKTTWFEPKLADGLVTFLLEG